MSNLSMDKLKFERTEMINVLEYARKGMDETAGYVKSLTGYQPSDLDSIVKAHNNVWDALLVLNKSDKTNVCIKLLDS